VFRRKEVAMGMCEEIVMYAVEGDRLCAFSVKQQQDCSTTREMTLF
jgi:hypothetical protein